MKYKYIEMLPSTIVLDGIRLCLRIKKEEGRWMIRYLQSDDRMGGYITRIKVNGDEGDELEKIAKAMYCKIEDIKLGRDQPIPIYKGVKKKNKYAEHIKEKYANK